MGEFDCDFCGVLPVKKNKICHNIFLSQLILMTEFGENKYETHEKFLVTKPRKSKISECQ